jgi:predicted secreted protein
MEKGKDLVVQVGGNVVAVSRSCSINFTRDEIDASNKDDGDWAKREYGRGGVTISTEGLVDYTDTDGYGAIVDALLNKTKLTLTYGLETTSTGDITYSGSFIVTGVDENAPDNDMATFSASFANDGAVTKTTAA